ncbi:MAG: hypothetical protein WCZ28_11270 [Burkholderiaceae bacterium]
MTDNSHGDIEDEAEFRSALVQSLLDQSALNIQVLALLTQMFSSEDDARQKLRPLANRATDLIRLQASLFKFLTEERGK